VKNIIIILIVTFTFLSCTKQQRETDEIDKEIKSVLSEVHEKLENDCLLVAVNVDSAVKAKLILKDVGFRKILAVSYKKPFESKLYGHIIYVFNYPKNDLGTFYAFDEKGSRVFGGDLRFLSAETIAEGFFPKYFVQRAVFLKN